MKWCFPEKGRAVAGSCQMVHERVVAQVRSERLGHVAADAVLRWIETGCDGSPSRLAEGSSAVRVGEVDAALGLRLDVRRTRANSVTAQMVG